MRFEKDDPLWKYGTEPEKPKITIDIRYYFKDFNDQYIGTHGILCKTKWFKFRIDSMPRYEVGQDHLSVERKEFTLTSKSAWDYLPEVWNLDWYQKELPKIREYMKAHLLRVVKRLVKDHFEVQAIEQDMKDDYEINFNFIEIDPPDEFF